MPLKSSTMIFLFPGLYLNDSAKRAAENCFHPDGTVAPVRSERSPLRSLSRSQIIAPTKGRWGRYPVQASLATPIHFRDVCERSD